VRGRGPARLRIRAVAAMTAACLVLAVACSGDDDSDSATPEESTTSPRPTTTAPPEGQTSRLERQVQQLLRSYDDLIRQITADPEVASDPEDPLYDELRSLMAPNTEMSVAVVNALVAQGSRGVAQRPQEDHELPIERKVDGRIETVSDGEFKVPVCAHLNYGLFNSSGEQIELIEGRLEPADATVVASDGELLLRRIETVDERSSCEEEGR
jgi:hypothetical protein